jgi:enoyl-CoA hydratase
MSDVGAADYETIRISAAAGIGRLTLNRPEALNAMTPAMMAEIADAIGRLESDRSVRAILIDAEGKGFSAGGDKDFLDAATRMAPSEVRDQIYASFGAAVRGVKLCRKPTVAAVNGPAYGAGCELAIACDFRVASEAASFCESWIALGLISPLGGMLLLPRLVGLAKATEMLMLGTVVKADEALTIGLVNSVVAAEELAESAHSFAEKLAAGPPLALAAMKDGLRRGLESTLAAEWERNVDVQALLLASDDFREGTAALRERRRPQFSGR